MSSFIVRPETINRIVSFLSHAQGSGQIAFSGVQYVLKEHGVHAETYRDKQDLVKQLFELNMKAVNQRYGDTDLSTMPGKVGKKPSDYTFRYEEGSRVRVFKSLECLIYQCSEGNVPETELFKFLEALKDTLATSIVHGLTEYEQIGNGGWGE